MVRARSQRMPLSDTQRAAMDLHLQRHTCYTTAAPLGTVSVRTYIIDSIERILDSTATHVRSLALHNSCIVCRDTAEFWHRLAILASGTEKVGWHALEYGRPLNELDRKSRYVYTWSVKNATLKFYTKILHHTGGESLIWFVCKHVPDADHSDSNTDSDEVWLPEVYN